MAVSVCLGMSQSAEMFAAAFSYLDPDEFFAHWGAGTQLSNMANAADTFWTSPLYRGPNAPIASPTVAYVAVDPANSVDFDVDTKAMLDNLVDNYSTVTTVHYWILIGADDHDPGVSGENGFDSCNKHESFQDDLEAWVAANPTYLTQGTNNVTLTINLGPEVLVTQPNDFEDELGHLNATGKSKAGLQFVEYLGFTGTVAQPSIRAVSTFTAVASGDLTPTTPTGTAIGDHVEIYVICRGVEAPAAPTNWTLRGTPSTTGTDLAVYSRDGGWQSGDTMPTFAGLAAAAGAVAVAYENVNLGFPYHLAERTETADVRYSDHAGAVTVTPTASETAVPNALQVVAVATPDDNAIGLLSGSEQSFTLHAGGASYEKSGGPAATQMAFGLAAKAVATATQTLTLPTFEQTVNGADSWESGQTVLQGSATLSLLLTGTLFQKAPTFFSGTVSTGAGSQTLTGSLFSKAPTFFSGTVAASYPLTGVLFTKAPTFFSGAVAPGAVDLAGTLFQKAPTFFGGAVSTGAGTQSLTGSLFQKAPTFPQGAVAATYDLAGQLFQNTPTFPQGTVTAGAVNLAGQLFTKTPTFHTGAVTATYELAGQLFQSAPMFPAGTVTAGAATLTGVLFSSTPTFFTGAITGVGTGFWSKNPVGYSKAPVGHSKNPVGYSKVGPDDAPPW